MHAGGAAAAERQAPSGGHGIGSARPMLVAQCMWAFATAAEARVAAHGAQAAGVRERRGPPVHTSAADYSGGDVRQLLARCWPEVPVADVMHALMCSIADSRPTIQVRLRAHRDRSPSTVAPAAAPAAQTGASAAVPAACCSGAARPSV